MSSKKKFLVVELELGDNLVFNMFIIFIHPQFPEILNSLRLRQCMHDSEVLILIIKCL